jgi:hypothetical protein
MRKKEDKLIYKLSGHTLFYHDEDNSNYKFYGKLNDLYDISVLVFHPEELTFREFIVDTASFLAFYEFAKDMNFNVHKRFVNEQGSKPNPVRTLIDNQKYSLIKTGDSKIVKSFVLAKMVEFGPDDDRQKGLDIKRVVVRPLPGSPLVGMDTLTMPHEVAVAFVEFVKSLFKNIDIELDLEGELNAND